MAAASATASGVGPGPSRQYLGDCTFTPDAIQRHFAIMNELVVAGGSVTFTDVNPAVIKHLRQAAQVSEMAGKVECFFRVLQEHMNGCLLPNGQSFQGVRTEPKATIDCEGNGRNRTLIIRPTPGCQHIILEIDRSQLVTSLHELVHVLPPLGKSIVLKENQALVLTDIASLPYEERTFDKLEHHVKDQSWALIIKTTRNKWFEVSKGRAHFAKVPHCLTLRSKHKIIIYIIKF